MADIYDQHSAAFSRVSGYAILKGGEPVATVAFKFPADGAGRLYAYVHWIGIEMVRGFAGGGGYDKRSAACAAAVRPLQGKQGGWRAPVSRSDHIGPVCDFLNALSLDGGASWDSALRDAGFTVVQAI